MRLQKTTLEPAQFLLNRARLRPRSLLQEYSVVMDKQLMQYLLVLRQNWRMLPDCSKLSNRNVQMYGHVFHDTNGRNRGQTLKILWYFSNELKMDTQLAGLLRERHFEQVLLELVKKVLNWESFFLLNRNKDYSYQYTWMILKWLERTRIWLLC